MCCAVATIDKHGDGVDRLYTDFSDEAGWRLTHLTHAQLMALFGDHAPALVQIVGFHVSMAHPDLMHSLHLGFVGFAISSELLILCSRFFFGRFDGDRLARLKGSLTVAFRRFRTYCRDHHVEHSQQPFKPGTIGATTAGVFPEWHGKAANAKAVCFWLTAELEKADPPVPPAELGLFRALTDVLHVLHRRPRVKLGRAERRDFYDTGTAAVRIYGKLNADAIDDRIALWVMRPKLHMIQHMLLEVLETGVLPAWSFSDEDFNGRIVACEKHKGHQLSLPRRIGLKWAIAKFRQTRAI